MSSEKSSDHLSASCWEKGLCWRIWLCGILCRQPSTHFNWSAKRLRNLYYHLIHFICIRFRSKTLLVLMDFKEIHIKANHNTHIQLFFPKNLSLIFFAFRISSFIQMTNESSQPTIADWGLTNCCDDAVIHNIHMLLVSLLPVEWLLSSTLNPSSPRLNSCLLNWFQRRKEEVGTCTGKLNFLPPECEFTLASALCSHSSLSHLRVLFNAIFFLDLWKNSSNAICSCVQESWRGVHTLQHLLWGFRSPSVRKSCSRYQRPHHMLITKKTQND